MTDKPDNGAVADSNGTTLADAFETIASTYQTDPERVQQVIEETFGLPPDDTRDNPGELKAGPEQKGDSEQRLADVLVEGSD